MIEISVLNPKFPGLRETGSRSHKILRKIKTLKFFSQKWKKKTLSEKLRPIIFVIKFWEEWIYRKYVTKSRNHSKFQNNWKKEFESGHFLEDKTHNSEEILIKIQTKSYQLRISIICKNRQQQATERNGRQQQATEDNGRQHITSSIESHNIIDRKS
jgi:hypothetical protein